MTKAYSPTQNATVRESSASVESREGVPPKRAEFVVVGREAVALAVGKVGPTVEFYGDTCRSAAAAGKRALHCGGKPRTV
ncbi:MAG TPA: hypothetical protein VH724_20665 [Candidatus Angelobacter sp.]|nr:hypothetical protein [Candidatus Angelobacter sp.]